MDKDIGIMCRKLALTWVIGLVVGLSGCASFEQGRVPKVTSMPNVSQYENKPSVYVDFSFFRGKPGGAPTEISNVGEKLRSVVSAAIKKTELFSQVDFTQRDAANIDYTVSVNVYNHGNEAGAAVSGFIAGFTFGVIPGMATDNYVVEIEVKDNLGNVLSKRVNRDSIDTWIGIWFIPQMSNTPEKAMTNVLQNQISSALIDLFNEGVFKYSLTNPYLYMG